MVAAINALASSLGISRLANITGLDRVGYPVIAAVRPLSRNLSVSLGKGPTVEIATLSAVMEAAELRYSEVPSQPLVTARYVDFSFGSAINPARFEAARPNDNIEQLALQWVRGEDMQTGEPVMVPWQSVSTDLADETGTGPRLLHSGSTGLAAAFDEPRAVLHGLYEVVERDSHANWNQLDDGLKLQTLTDPRTSESPAVQQLLTMVRNAELEVLVWNMTTDNQIPCFLVELLDFAPEAPTPYAQGTAAHLNAGTAIEKALAEALQVRLTYISGSRDDLEWGDYGERFQAVVKSRHWLLEQPLLSNGLTVDENPHQDVAAALVEIPTRLRAKGERDINVVRLSPADGSVSVIKVVAPAFRDSPDPNYYEDQRRKKQQG